MRFKKCLAILVLSIICIVNVLAEAKSLYVVEHKGPRFLIAFEIIEDQFEFQDLSVLPHHGSGSRDIACDEETGALFITYEEGSPTRHIEVYSTSLNHLQTVTLEGQSSGGSFMGVVYDAANHKLIVGEENKNKLFVFNWNTTTRTLNTPPTEITLTDLL